ncbi:MAG TPA: CBASS cGAMP synthase [Devosia sp.]|jgi:hypothetical protein|uniref:CBASS cGAMP synthase n=1 Tax=Devosia sp. TaxID=1871048 RepID=UPI002DDC9194|nr:CBASS cGAMP synthase [Devosia sp.]HEV2516046.1 CBASS cGAMP synthase [Devosia sp.]
MANVAKLLYSTVEECFLDNLEPDASPLKAARTKIRDHLRTEFAFLSKEIFGRIIAPKFFTQGSCAYKTLNEPAWPPEQQKDMDDGCYLPLSFVRGARPSQAAALFFEFVDNALRDLARREGWTHVGDKDTCVRLEIGVDSHVDVPLYAIPDAEFARLRDTVIAAQMEVNERARPDTWEALPSDAVLLAHRQEDWIESDPRKIHGWFLDAVELYSERLRRDCRYMKAWRDHHALDRYKVSSILLMACVFYAYEAIRGPFLPDREDERFLQVVERIPRMLSGKVENPSERDEDLNRIPVKHRETVARAVEKLASEMRQIVKHCTDEREAVDAMIAVLGKRVPDRTDLVSVTASAVAAVSATPKRQVEAPMVGRSSSG